MRRSTPREPRTRPLKHPPRIGIWLWLRGDCYHWPTRKLVPVLLIGTDGDKVAIILWRGRRYAVRTYQLTIDDGPYPGVEDREAFALLEGTLDAQRSRVRSFFNTYTKAGIRADIPKAFVIHPGGREYLFQVYL